MTIQTFWWSQFPPFSPPTFQTVTTVFKLEITFRNKCNAIKFYFLFRGLLFIIFLHISFSSYVHFFCLFLISQRCTKRGIEHDAPVARYYERLATVQARGSQASHQVLRDILKDVQSNMVPRGLLKEWAVHTFQTATDYWTFRKTVSISIHHLEGCNSLKLTIIYLL